MTTNPDFLRCIEERKNEGFFKVLQSLDVSSENMRALPHGFVRRFSEKDLSRKMKIRARWGSSWEVGISKNPRFYFMEKSGWEKFVRDNALGNNEFITFIHKGKMRFTVNIFNQNGKEMIQPPQSAVFLASSSRVKTEQREKNVNKDEVEVSSELSNRGPTTAAESNGRGTNRRKFKLGKKKAEETQNSKRAEKVVRARRCFLGASSSSSVAEFTILLKKSYVTYLRIPGYFAKDHMPREKTMFKIHHPNEKKSWYVRYWVRTDGAIFSRGWRRLIREYPLKVGDTCKITLIKPDELILVVSKQ